MYLTKKMISYELDAEHSLLINTLSGAIDLADPHVQGVLRDLRADNPDSRPALSEELESHLRRRNYLFDSEEDEARHTRELFAAMKQRLEEEPVQFAICPTYACNLACTYCFEGELTSRPMRVMKKEQIENAFRAIELLRDRFHPGSNGHVILFGGEPLLQPTRSGVESILMLASAKGYGVDVVTNGVEAGEFADLLRAHKEIVKQVQITLDGPQEIHDRRRPFRGGMGSFEGIRKNVQQLLELDLPVTVRINVDNDNVQFLAELVEFLDQQGWNLFPNFSFYIFPVSSYGDEGRRAKVAEDKLLAQVQMMFQGEGQALPAFALHGFRVLGHVASVIAPESISLKMPPLFTYCEANGLRYFGFGPDGVIYPCGQTIGQKDLAIGKFDPDFELNESACEQWLRRSVLTIPECQACPLATLCGGGCAYGSLKRTASILSPNCQDCGPVLYAYLDRMKEYMVRRYSGALRSSKEATVCA
ncbi:MAG: radical SAM protein [Candidatus Sulfotelmatobacter sp.]